MKLRFPSALILFIGSYLPLSLILLAQDFQYEMLDGHLCWPFGDQSAICEIPFRNSGYSITIFLICLVCFLVTLFVLWSVNPKNPIDVREVKYIPAELMSYTLPYVVSFMSLEYQETGKFIGILIFLGWIFLISHRSGQLILNPLLIAFGWRLYEIKYTYPGNDREYFGRALAKESLEPEHRYKHTIIQDAIIVRPEKSGRKGVADAST